MSVYENWVKVINLYYFHNETVSLRVNTDWKEYHAKSEIIFTSFVLKKIYF